MRDEQCIFCRILAGEAPAHVVYEDELVMVFLDINQASPGHLLIVPRVHVPYWWELDERYAAHMGVVARPLMKALRQAVHPDGINILQNNERAAGQDVFHVHMHLIPRWQHDGRIGKPPKYEPQDVMAERAANIRAALEAVQT